MKSNAKITPETNAAFEKALDAVRAAFQTPSEGTKDGVRSDFVTLRRVDLGRIHDQIMRAGRLALAIHRLTGEHKTDGCLCDPATLVAWESFIAASNAVEELSHLLGFTDREDTNFEA